MSDTNTDTTARPDLEAIGKRAEAATMGPWYADFIRGAGAAVVRPEAICTFAYPHTNLFGRPNWGNGDDRGPSTTKQFFKDVDFVVAARTDVPALIAYALQLEHDVEFFKNYSDAHKATVWQLESENAKLTKRAEVAETQLAELSNLPNADSVRVNGRLYAPAIMPALPTQASEAPIATNLSQTVFTEGTQGKGE